MTLTVTLADRRGRHNPGAYLARMRAAANRRADLLQLRARRNARRPSLLSIVFAAFAALFVGAR